MLKEDIKMHILKREEMLTEIQEIEKNQHEIMKQNPDIIRLV